MNKMNKQEQAEKEFMRKALGEIDTVKEMFLYQKPLIMSTYNPQSRTYMPHREILEKPFKKPDLMYIFWTYCGHYTYLDEVKLKFLTDYIEIFETGTEIPEDYTGYYVEFDDFCPICGLIDRRSGFEFRFRKITETAYSDIHLS